MGQASNTLSAIIRELANGTVTAKTCVSQSASSCLASFLAGTACQYTKHCTSAPSLLFGLSALALREHRKKENMHINCCLALNAWPTIANYPHPVARDLLAPTKTSSIRIR